MKIGLVGWFHISFAVRDISTVKVFSFSFWWDKSHINSHNLCFQNISSMLWLHFLMWCWRKISMSNEFRSNKIHISVMYKPYSSAYFWLTLIWRCGKSVVDQLLNLFIRQHSVELANNFHNWLKLCFHVINICDVFPPYWIFLSIPSIFFTLLMFFFISLLKLISISQENIKYISRNFLTGNKILFATLVHMQKVYPNCYVMWICLELFELMQCLNEVSERVRI